MSASGGEAVQNDVVRSGSEYNDGRREVKVDMKGMIAKILTRYANKQTFLRELLQNANDAGGCISSTLPSVDDLLL